MSGALVGSLYNTRRFLVPRPPQVPFMGASCILGGAFSTRSRSWSRLSRGLGKFQGDQVAAQKDTSGPSSVTNVYPKDLSALRQS